MGSSLRVNIVFEDRPAHEAMRQIRKTLNADTRRALLQAAERIALPAAKRGAPRRTGALAASLVAKATTRNAYLTTSMTRRQGSRRLGLLEFGGTRRDVIQARDSMRGYRGVTLRGDRPRAKALRLPDGRFAARISTPRHYKAQGFMYRAVESKRAQVTNFLEEKLAEAAQRAINSRSPYPY